MEQEKTSNEIHRKFGLLQIEWQIDNYFPATCRKRWTIHSPGFLITGHPLTKWRFSLTGSKDGTGNSVASIYLERLESDLFSGPVRVYWKIWYICGSGNITMCEKECLFAGKGCMPARIRNFKRLENGYQLTSSDKFLIGGLVLVHSTDHDTMFAKPKDPGLKYLSQDLGVLFKVQNYSDIVLDIDGIPVLGHKAILSSRNGVLSTAIDDKKDCEDIEFDFYDAQATEKVLSYLYTGNLNYVLRIPSVAIHEAVDYFDVKKLKDIYLHDFAHLNTTFETKELNFRWVIKDIESNEETSIVSKQFGKGVFNAALQLRLYLHGEGENINQMGIFLEAVEGSLPDEVYVMFEVLDLFGTAIVRKAKRWSSHEGERLGVEDFVSRKILKDDFYACCETFYVFCKIRAPTGFSSKSVCKSIKHSFIKISSEDPYLQLSTDVLSLLKTGKHSDLTIICNAESFKVHKCILSARSCRFRDIIQTLEGKSDFTLSDIEPNILRIVLYYMYSGILKKYEIVDVMKIYIAAEKIVLFDLKYKCSKILRDNLHSQNVLDALFLAKTSKDLKLKYSAFKFIAYNPKDVKLQEKWKLLKEDKILFKELSKYRKSIQNPPKKEYLDDCKI